MTIEMLPLNKLVPSPVNVRKTDAAQGIEELAASITAHGLLQNLQVRPTPRGTYEVVAGGRRLAALKWLAKQKTLAKDEAIACHVLAENEDAVEVSLAENTMRLDMHPADQFEAFKQLADAGRPPEDIAARFRRIGFGRAPTFEARRRQSGSHAELPGRRNDTRTPDGLHAQRRPRCAGKRMA